MATTADAGGRRPAHRPSRRPAILEAAQAAFVAQGPAAVTIADIAEQAGMTAAAVYYHFPSKADVLLELLDRLGQELATLFEPPPRRGRVDLGAWLGDRYDALEAWRADDAAGATLYLTSSVGFSPAVEALRRAQRRDMALDVAQVVDRARSRRRPVESHVIALGLLCLLLDTVAEVGAPRDAAVQVGLRLAGIAA